MNYLVDVECSDLEIIRPPKDIITVSGEYIQLNCLFRGNLHTLGLSLKSYWTVNTSQHESKCISDNSTDPYHIAVYPTCETCCNFTSQLTILSVPAELDGTKLTCVEQSSQGTDPDHPVIRQNTSTLSKYTNGRIKSSINK